MIIRSVVLACIAVFHGGISDATAQSILEEVNGKWRGGGWFRQEASHPKRATKCLFDIGFSHDLNTLFINGKCAGGGKSGKISGSLVEVSSNKFTGHWRATNGFSTENMSGIRSGDKIVLTWRAVPKNSEALENYSLHWTIKRDKISISTFSGAKGQFSLSSLVLLR